MFWLAFFACCSIAWFFVGVPWMGFLLLSVGLIAFVASTCARKVHHRHEAYLKSREFRIHADHENAAMMRGDLAIGLFGDYPPAEMFLKPYLDVMKKLTKTAAEKRLCGCPSSQSCLHKFDTSSMAIMMNVVASYEELNMLRGLPVRTRVQFNRLIHLYRNLEQIADNFGVNVDDLVRKSLKATETCRGEVKVQAKLISKGVVADRFSFRK